MTCNKRETNDLLDCLSIEQATVSGGCWGSGGVGLGAGLISFHLYPGFPGARRSRSISHWNPQTGRIRKRILFPGGSQFDIVEKFYIFLFTLV